MWFISKCATNSAKKSLGSGFKYFPFSPHTWGRFPFWLFPMRRYTDLILMRLMSVFGGKFVCPNWSTASNRKSCLTCLVDRVHLGLIFILSTSSGVSLCVFCSVRFFVPLWKGFGRVLTTHKIQMVDSCWWRFFAESLLLKETTICKLQPKSRDRPVRCFQVPNQFTFTQIKTSAI